MVGGAICEDPGAVDLAGGGTISVDQDGQGRALLELARLQQESMSALMALAGAGERPPNEAYDRYLAAARSFLAGTVDYERLWPGSFPVQPVAQPLVQQLSMYADHLRADGELARANRCLREAVELANDHLDATATARLQREWAKEAAAQGRFHEALETLERACSTLAEEGDKLGAGQAVLDLANVYEWLGDYERALAAVQTVGDEMADALRDGTPSEQDVLEAVGRQLASIASGQATHEGENALALRRLAYEILQARGRINRYLGNYDEAERLLAETRPYAEPLGVLSAIDYHLAAIACARGRLEEAEAILARIEPDFDRPMSRPRRPALRVVQADVVLARGKPHDALDLLARGTADLETTPDLDLSWRLEWRRGRALAALDEPEQAIGAYRSGARAADDLRKAPLGYRLDTAYLRDKLPMFEGAIDLAVERGDGPSAVWFSELVKARALSAAISVPRLPDEGAADDEARFDAISARLDALEFAVYTGSAGSAALAERARLLEQRDAVLERIRVADPRWRSMTQPAPLDVEAIAARLGGSGRAALAFRRRPGKLVCCVLDGKGVSVGVQPLPDAVEGRLQTYAENLVAGADLFLSDLSGELGVGLDDLVPGPILERARAASTLVVVPHGLLHLLPWAAMTAGGARLFESAAVGVLPCLASLAQLDDDPAAEPRAALIGDPDYSGLDRYEDLPEAGKELAEIAGVYGDRLLAAPLARDGATEAAFWELAGRDDVRDAVLHVACHATLEPDEPLACGLLLTGSKVDAAEVATRRVQFAEVVLSACSTGWRPQRTRSLELVGDDALGLTASFLEAGARFLLVSVPKAQDAAARAFSVAWHRRRCAGDSPLAAYRAAQQELYHASPDEAWAWAGTTAYGCR